MFRDGIWRRRLRCWGRVLVFIVIVGMSNIGAYRADSQGVTRVQTTSPPYGKVSLAAPVETNSTQMDNQTTRIVEIGDNDFSISDIELHGGAYVPAVIHNSVDNEYLAVWLGVNPDNGGGRLYGQRLNAAGQKIGVNGFQIGDMGSDQLSSYDPPKPTVVYNSVNNEYLAVWLGMKTDDTVREIYGQRLNASGEELGPNDFRISDMRLEAPIYAVSSPVIAYNNETNEYLVVWSFTGISTEGIYGQRLNASGEELGPNDFRISNVAPSYIPAAAYNHENNEYLVVSGGFASQSEGIEIYGQRLNASGEELGPNDFRISDMGPEGDAFIGGAYNPAITYNSETNEYLVVWDSPDMGDGEFEIYGQRLSASGEELGANDFRISDMGPEMNEGYDGNRPFIIHNSSANEYLVVWRGYDDADIGREIYGQLLHTDGQELGANDFRISDMGTDGIGISHEASNPTVTYNPVADEYLVVWSGSDITVGEYEIHGQRLALRHTQIYLPLIE